MKSYQQHLEALEEAQDYIHVKGLQGSEMCATAINKLDRVAQEMLETLKELENPFECHDKSQLKEWGYSEEDEEEETEEQYKLWEAFLERCKNARGKNA